MTITVNQMCDLRLNQDACFLFDTQQQMYILKSLYSYKDSYTLNSQSQHKMESTHSTFPEEHLINSPGYHLAHCYFHYLISFLIRLL